MRLHDIPRYPLTFGPSPLQHLRRLSDHLGGAQVWAKREDVSSGPEPVYEGKSLAGLIDLVREGDIPEGSTVLYAHLGGQPAINAYHSLWPAS